jgi:hypothetical protein
MTADKRSQKLKRLVVVQRHLEKLAEYDLADATRQRAEIAESLASTRDAITSFEEVHRPFARNYAERLQRLNNKDLQLQQIQRAQELKVLKERTKGDRLQERMQDAAMLEDRKAEDDAVYDLIDLTMMLATPASSKLDGA